MLLPAEALVPWGVARRILSELRGTLGQRAVREGLAPERARLSLVLRGLLGELTPEERLVRAEHRAERLGFMTHNSMRIGPVVDAFVRVLDPLLRVGGVTTLAVPDAAYLDTPSVTLLSALERLPGLDFVFGLDTDLDGVAPEDLDPIVDRPRGIALGKLDLLASESDVEVLELDRVDRLADPSPPPPILARREGAAPLDVDLDEERAALAASLAEPAAVERALAALRDAFGCYGFATAIQLGRRLLDEAALEPSARCEVHMLLGLAAYNQQVESDQDPRLPAFLEEHFRAALALAPSAADRSHLRYRLCINTGRRKGALEDAAQEAERALEEARDPGLTPAVSAFLEAWALNGRAYLHARSRNLPGAIADSLRAHALVRGVEPEPGLDNEVRTAEVVFYDNLAELHTRLGDLDGAMRFQAALEGVEAKFPGGDVAPYRWVTLLRTAGRLEEAALRAREGVRTSRGRRGRGNEERYLMELGDIAYRLGDAGGALRSFSEARRIRSVHAAIESQLALEASCGLAALRDGRLDEADRFFESALAMLPAEDERARAELLATRALVAARRGDGESADALANDAIERVVELGERDPLLRVSRLAGQACVALGREAEARAAFEQALEIAFVSADEAHDDAVERSAAPPPASEIVAVCCGLLALGRGATDGPEARDHEHARTALLAMPEALAEAEAWWSLPALLAGLPGEVRDDPTLTTQLEAVRRAARQRTDCATLVG